MINLLAVMTGAIPTTAPEQISTLEAALAALAVERAALAGCYRARWMMQSQTG